MLWCAGAKTPSVTEAPFPYSVSSYGQFWFHRNDGVACHEAGVAYAVLDPDEKQAKRVFDLQKVIEQAQGGSPA